MRRLALIPARGGSVRLPRKNVVDFLGRPIIAYTVSAALETGLFDRVCVSTDDAEIAAAGRAAGAEILDRPPDLARNTAQVREVCLQVLDAEEAEGRHYDVLCCLYATAPLRTAADIRAVVSLIEPGRCDFALAVTTYDHSPHQALTIDARGWLVPIWPDLVNLRSQDVPEPFVDNGSTHAVTVAAFRRDRSFYGPNLRGHVMPLERSIDIDLPVHLEMARFFAERLR